MQDLEGRKEWDRTTCKDWLWDGKGENGTEGGLEDEGMGWLEEEGREIRIEEWKTEIRKKMEINKGIDDGREWKEMRELDEEGRERRLEE